MSLLNLIIKLSVDGADAESKLKRTKGLIEDLGERAASAFSVGALSMWVVKTAEAADAADDLAEQMNVTISQLFQLERAAVGAGLQTEAFQKILIKVAEARQKAGEGDKETQDIFASFGVSLRDVNDAGLKTIDIVQKLSDRLKELGSLSPQDEAKWINLVGAKGAKAQSALKNIGSSRSLDDQEWNDKLVSQSAGAGRLYEEAKLEIKQAGQRLLGRIIYGAKTIYGLGKGLTEGDVTKYLMQEANNDINQKIAAEERITEERSRGNAFTEKVNIEKGKTDFIEPIKMKGINRRSIPSASASSYGNFIFGAYNEQYRVAMQQLHHLRSIDANTKAKNTLSKSMAGLEAAISAI